MIAKNKNLAREAEAFPEAKASLQKIVILNKPSLSRRR